MARNDGKGLAVGMESRSTDQLLELIKKLSTESVTNEMLNGLSHEQLVLVVSNALWTSEPINFDSLEFDRNANAPIRLSNSKIIIGRINNVRARKK